MSLLSTTYVPMLKEFYKGVWVHLHQLLKEWHSIFKDLKVIVGPIYEKSYDVPSHVIGNVDKVKIPSHFFMIILRCKVKQGGSCEDFTPLSFILPHRMDVTNCQNYNEYLTDNEARIRDIELMTGFEFFHNLKVEKALELRTFLPNGLWTL
ncbi:hypothetical protein FSP39_002916 [Pinctada imbricata]|uniref:ENPP1-3/EXOG-like endonuclease/phosphodiesterase domain-containing protein n=1 Tax=Pinctada imbricata TaxID=66713 RepID=A0AA88XRW3_PINIB|nr:hypothetical protein FSP39_002916 [Pinctada imbricata]